jgi:hypothetical protein
MTRDTPTDLTEPHPTKALIPKTLVRVVKVVKLFLYEKRKKERSGEVGGAGRWVGVGALWLPHRKTLTTLVSPTEPFRTCELSSPRPAKPPCPVHCRH